VVVFTRVTCYNAHREMIFPFFGEKGLTRSLNIDAAVPEKQLLITFIYYILLNYVSLPVDLINSKKSQRSPDGLIRN